MLKICNTGIPEGAPVYCGDPLDRIDHNNCKNNRKKKIFPKNNLELLEIPEACCDHIDHNNHKNNRKNKIFPKNRESKHFREFTEIAETCCDHIDRIDHIVRIDHIDRLLWPHWPHWSH